jgi:tellurite methyltransferase
LVSPVSDKWNRIYLTKSAVPKAALVLEQNKHLLPVKGEALDLACGQGGNALLLAQAGLNVQAWDVSDVAIDQLKNLASTQGLAIDASVRDVVFTPPAANSFDVIVVSFFLDRALCAVLAAAIKPGGLIIYQTYCRNKVSEGGPRNPEYLLEDNELLFLFPNMKVRLYREEDCLGDVALGYRNQAYLVAEKPR